MLVRVTEDVVHNPGMGDKGGDSHLGAALTQQRVDVVDPVDRLRPRATLSALLSSSGRTVVGRVRTKDPAHSLAYGMTFGWQTLPEVRKVDVDGLCSQGWRA